MPQKKLRTPDQEPVEIVDAAGRPLAVVSAGEAHRQSLPHRSVLVLVYDGRDRIVLGRRPPNAQAYPGRWDLPVRGHIAPGEAARDAAQRLAEAYSPGLGGVYAHMSKLTASQATNFEAVSIFRYTARMRPDHTGRVLSANRDELAALAQDFRELLTPDLVQAFESGLLFTAKAAQQP